MLIDATHEEETRVVVTNGDEITEFDFETASRRPLTGNIYLAKVTRIEPALQAAFIEYGSNRHGFLAFSEIHPDYFVIPVADRQTLEDEEKNESAEAVGKNDSSSPAAPLSGTGALETSGSLEIVDSTTPDDRDIAGMAIVEYEPGSTVLLDDADSEKNGSRPPENASEAFSAASSDSPAISEQNESRAAASDNQPRPSKGTNGSKKNSSRRSHQFNRNYNIQEVIRVNQILLVQITKEERGNKGAALTTYVSLAGRYCVLMPNTARGGGISRKITNPAHRKKLKAIAEKLDVKDGTGLIIRTAGAQRTRQEIRRDNEFLMRQWDEIRELTLKSIAPAQIFEEGDLIKRSIRDIYSKEIDQVIVEGERGYRVAKDFMKMIMPSHARKVRHYTGEIPLFVRHGVEDFLSGMFDPVVRLPSGGYIVIDTTEALVAIDVNSGRATRQGSVEQTALKTNLEAAPEIAKQLRLRDLAGLIVIDFIDMEDRRNNAAVEKCMRDSIRKDRSRVQTGRISEFGLFEMSRQRLRSGMVEASTTPCRNCHGTGTVRSDVSVALSALRELSAKASNDNSADLLVRAPVPAVNFILNEKRGNISAIEAKFGIKARFQADPSLTNPDFIVEKDTTPIPQPGSENVVSLTRIPKHDGSVRETASEEPKQKRRRRRRGKSIRRDDQERQKPPSPDVVAADALTPESTESLRAPEGDSLQQEEFGKKPSRHRRKRKTRRTDEESAKAAADSTPAAAPNTAGDVSGSEPSAASDQAEDAKKKPARQRRNRKKTQESTSESANEPRGELIENPEIEQKPKLKKAGSKSGRKLNRITDQASENGEQPGDSNPVSSGASESAGSIEAADNVDSNAGGKSDSETKSKPPAKRTRRRSKAAVNALAEVSEPTTAIDRRSEEAIDADSIASPSNIPGLGSESDGRGSGGKDDDRGRDEIESAGSKSRKNTGRRGWWVLGRASN